MLYILVLCLVECSDTRPCFVPAHTSRDSLARCIYIEYIIIESNNSSIVPLDLRRNRKYRYDVFDFGESLGNNLCTVTALFTLYQVAFMYWVLVTLSIEVSTCFLFWLQMDMGFDCLPTPIGDDTSHGHETLQY